MEFLAAGVGAGLLNYNRKNFMFDKEQYRERAYFSQEMKVSKYELYREDIKDLTDLTVSKMDVYMVINVLQLLFCVMLFTEGMPKPRTTPLWLHWILAASSGSAVLYFVLSIWLGMHASIAAHSFGVRLLTQFVRLPVPNLQQIHRAAAKAKDYEALSLIDMLRIPVLQQQFRKLTATLGNLSFENRAEDTTGLDDSFLPEVYMPSLEETAALRHIQLYRELQANWQAYDAYCRVCMALGTNQLLQSINAYCLGVLLSETSSGWAAACCMAVISSVSWLVVRLDVLVSWRMLMMALALQLGIPLLTLCCLATQILFKWAGALALVRVLVPTIFVLHLFWMVCCLRLAAGRGDKVSLPGKFRGVLYLDVFGWLSPEGESPRAAPRRREEAEGPDPTEQPAEDEAEPSPQLPVAMYMTLAELSVRQRDGLARQLEKWQNPRVEAVLNDERWMEEVAKMRRRFEEVDEELSATLQRAREQPQQDSSAAPRVWLKLEWFASFQTMEYWYDPDTGESVWTMPPETDLTSDLDTMGGSIETLFSNTQALAKLIAEDEEQHQQELARADEARRVSGSVASHSEVVESDGTRSLLRGSNAEAAPDSFYSSGAVAPVTFQPVAAEEAGAPSTETLASSRSPPGHLPWVTFRQGTLALLGVWCVGVLWSIFHVFLNIDIVIKPKSESSLANLVSSWVMPSHVEIELLHQTWPHPHFKPQAITCQAHDDGDLRLLVAERHAIHSLTVPGGHSMVYGSQPSWQPVAEQCLLQAPDFLAEGVRGMTLRCRDSECFLVLLGLHGRSMLSCPLGLSSSNSTLSELLGGPWKVIADVSGSDVQRSEGSFWTMPGQGNVLVQLGSQLQKAAGLPQDHKASAALMPLLEVPVRASSEVTDLVTLGSSALSLQRDGTLLIHDLSGSYAETFRQQLPADHGARWLGLCPVRGREMLLVGSVHHGSELAVWRMSLPLWM